MAGQNFGDNTENLTQSRFEIATKILFEDKPTLMGLATVKSMCQSDPKLAKQLQIYGVEV